MSKEIENQQRGYSDEEVIQLLIKFNQEIQEVANEMLKQRETYN